MVSSSFSLAAQILPETTHVCQKARHHIGWRTKCLVGDACAVKVLEDGDTQGVGDDWKKDVAMINDRMLLLVYTVDPSFVHDRLWEPRGWVKG